MIQLAWKAQNGGKVIRTATDASLYRVKSAILLVMNLGPAEMAWAALCSVIGRSVAGT